MSQPLAERFPVGSYVQVLKDHPSASALVAGDLAEVTGHFIGLTLFLQPVDPEGKRAALFPGWSVKPEDVRLVPAEETGDVPIEVGRLVRFHATATERAGIDFVDAEDKGHPIALFSAAQIGDTVRVTGTREIERYGEVLLADSPRYPGSPVVFRAVQVEAVPEPEPARFTADGDGVVEDAEAPIPERPAVGSRVIVDQYARWTDGTPEGATEHGPVEGIVEEEDDGDGDVQVRIETALDPCCPSYLYAAPEFVRLVEVEHGPKATPVEEPPAEPLAEDVDGAAIFAGDLVEVVEGTSHLPEGLRATAVQATHAHAKTFLGLADPDRPIEYLSGWLPERFRLVPAEPEQVEPEAVTEEIPVVVPAPVYEVGDRVRVTDAEPDSSWRVPAVDARGFVLATSATGGYDLVVAVEDAGSSTGWTTAEAYHHEVVLDLGPLTIGERVTVRWTYGGAPMSSGWDGPAKVVRVSPDLVTVQMLGGAYDGATGAFPRSAIVRRDGSVAG